MTSSLISMQQIQRLGAVALFALLATPFMRGLLEARLVTHMLVQIPLLILAGWWLGLSLRGEMPGFLRRWNAGGAAGIAILIFASLFWMLPRSLDGALDNPWMELAKFYCLPLAIGLPLALSWPAAHPLLKGFLQCNFISMLGVLTWLYLSAPVRICNNYLGSEQKDAGLLFGFIAIFLALLWGARLFFAPDAAGVKRQRTDGAAQAKQIGVRGLQRGQTRSG